MKKYEEVYKWKVLDEIKGGTIVYVIDKAQPNSSNAILSANSMRAANLLYIINDENSTNRYSFYKVVESEETEE